MAQDMLRGFLQDYNYFLKKFEEENDPSFPAFACIWRDMHFSLVYAGRRFKQVGIFAIEVFSFVKNNLLQSDTIMRQIFNVYLLYGLFYKQPEYKLVKILFTFNEWTMLQRCIDDFQKYECVHALYIIYKMIYNDAFEFSADGILRTSFVLVDNAEDIIELNTTLNKSKLQQDFMTSLVCENKYKSAMARLQEKGYVCPVYTQPEFTKSLCLYPKEQVIPKTKNLDKIVCRKRISRRNFKEDKVTPSTFNIVKYGITVADKHVFRKKPKREEPSESCS